MPMIWTWGGKRVWTWPGPTQNPQNKKSPTPATRITASEAPSLGYIVFESWPDRYACIALLGDQVPNITAGLGGWSTQPRARRHSFTIWNGVDPLALDIPILFDNYADGHSIEGAINQLEMMAGLGGGQPPFVLFNSGGVVQHDYHDDPTRDWVIESIDWGDADRNEYGNRVRQACTVKLRLYLEDDPLVSTQSAAQLAAAKRNNSKRKDAAARGNKARHVVKGARENLESIAAAELGSSKKWHQLKKLNPKYRDPKKILTMGTVIRLK